MLSQRCTSMTIFLRCDAGGAYGLGHAMRCKTIAQALHAQAPDVPLVFVTTTPALQDIIGTDSESWSIEYCKSGWDAFPFLLLAAQSGDVLFVDMPQFLDSPIVMEKLRARMSIARIDAPWAEPEQCDLLVLPGMHHSAETIERLDRAFGEHLLLGAEHVILQEEILPGARIRLSRRRGKNTIFFAAGGSDPDAALPLMYDMTRTLCEHVLIVETLYGMGSAAPPWVLQAPTPYEQVTGFSLGALADVGLFVTLWGTVVYEALALGTPTLTIARTRGEADDAARLEEATEGAVQSLGTLAELMRETLCDRIVALWNDFNQRKRMHYASAGLFDGQGAARVARAVLTLRSSSHYGAQLLP